MLMLEETRLVGMDNFKVWLIAQLRRVHYKWPAKEEAKKEAKVSYGTYMCATCKGLFKRKDTQIDHIEPVISTKEGFIDWNTFICRLFAEKSAYQVLCKKCHKEKSKGENAKRRKK